MKGWKRGGDAKNWSGGSATADGRTGRTGSRGWPCPGLIPSSTLQDSCSQLTPMLLMASCASWPEGILWLQVPAESTHHRDRGQAGRLESVSASEGWELGDRNFSFLRPRREILISVLHWIPEVPVELSPTCPQR